MASLFRFDGPIGRLISRITDLFFLNILWLICCLPIVTIAASTAALHYVTMRMVRDEDSGIFKNFFHSFRQNLKQSVVISLIYVISGIFLLFVIYLFNHLELGGWYLWSVFLYLALLIHFIVFGYVFPIFAKFENSTRMLIKNAYFMAIRYPVNTLVVTVINALPLILAFFVPELFARLAILWVLIMFAVQSYWNASLFRRIFDQFIPAEEITSDEDFTIGGNEEE